MDAVRTGTARSWLPRAWRLPGFLALALGAWLAGPAPIWAQGDARQTPSLLDRLTPEVMSAVFPGITRLEMADDHGPVAAAAYRREEMAGYVFSTLDVLRAPGYSSTPFDVVAGVTMDGRITGAVVLFHREPYLINDARRTALLVTFLQAIEGSEARLGVEGGLPPDFVAGATISARAMRNAVQEGARMVLRYRTEEIVVTEPTIDMINFKPMSPEELVADGGLALAHVSNAKLAEAMARAGVGDLLPEVPMSGGPDDTYIDFVAGYGNAPKVGRNGAGLEPYDELINGWPAGTQGIFVATLGGVYDHRGTRYHNLSSGFLLDRVKVTQGGRDFSFTKADMIVTRGKIADILVLPPDSGFDPMQPWRADLFASAVRPDGKLERFVLAGLAYTLPGSMILMPEPKPLPAWIEPWADGMHDIAILSTALALLTALLAFQAQLARRRQLHRWLRTSFLVFTLVWIGWIASAQLSVVHLLNYLKAPFVNLDLAFYLAEPLIVILTGYTAISLVLLGRGVFCGWLCPFGALQDLLAQAARALNLPQWTPSMPVQRVLWNGKYVTLGVILLLAVVAPDAAIVAEEVEPFKTAITAVFVRGLPYVVYAVVLLVIGLFAERAFCRFLCPLGAGLALLDRLHLFQLLKRRPECGNPCQLCERSCPVKAIDPSGKVVTAECFQCLDCMVEYYDDRRCPPLAQLRKEREQAAGFRPVLKSASANSRAPA
ncbi:MAG: 4Fe-4S binding protein [Boseongicola sp. SB0664_bin_43]|uniref:4Fe-4S binding protein n=1 Tax=Boseongicola sp. SB0664_bin_43 TaxID=2604844 RepID=A0A6B0Y4D9_9RHOB|nr:4Fe-4S binding protein [Boseongicola sp. SB0664_bin_43]